MILKDYLSSKKVVFEEGLAGVLPSYEDIPIINDAVKYSLFAGGKRIRPIMSFMANELFGGRIEDVMPFACSLEMIHTYSLIHDDLPSMDDDDYRRGKPTNHKVYGEAFAILAGDALLNCAFEIMLKAIERNPRPEFIKAASQIATAAGVSGMIGGQCIDIFYEDKVVDINTLKLMHEKKTGAMLTAPLVVGALTAGASEKDIRIIREYGAYIGLAFQIADDILDVEGSSEKLGKSVGSDANNHKSTFVSCYGLDESKRIAAELSKKAQKLLEPYGERGALLIELADYIVNRDN